MTFLKYTIDHKPRIKWCVVRVLILSIKLVVEGRVILKHHGRVIRLNNYCVLVNNIIFLPSTDNFRANRWRFAVASTRRKIRLPDSVQWRRSYSWLLRRKCQVICRLVVWYVAATRVKIKIIYWKEKQ